MRLTETPRKRVSASQFPLSTPQHLRRHAAVKLVDIAKVIRSKNAGPTTLTLDLLFNDEASYNTACASEALTPHAIAKLYETSPEKVEVLPYPPALAIKIVMPRRIVSGDPRDS